VLTVRRVNGKGLLFGIFAGKMGTGISLKANLTGKRWRKERLGVSIYLKLLVLELCKTIPKERMYG